MDLLFIWQIIGLIALSLQIISFIEKKDKSFFLFLSISSVFWAVHYFLLGLISWWWVNVLDVIKNYVGYKWWKSQIIFYGFWILYLFIGIYLFDGSIYWIIPILASLLSIYAIFFSRWENLRVYYGIIMFLWLVYNILWFSIAGIITDILLIWELLYVYYKIVAEKKRFKKKIVSILGDKKWV